ncbi:MAG: exosortase U [Thermoguttaceae bacterium]
MAITHASAVNSEGTDPAMKETPANSPAIRKLGRLSGLAIALILAGHLPFLGAHLYSVWQVKPHYQFFPVLLVAIGWLVWQRWPRETPDLAHPRLQRVLLLLGLAVLAVGVILFYPWFAAVALVLTACGVVAGLGGRQTRQDFLPVCVLLCFLVPPPLGWDEDWIRSMQLETSRASSLVLDVFGDLHLMEGNVIVLPGHRLLVEEACSGISSLFTLLIATGCFLVLARRPALWSVLLLVSSVFWAGLGNTARVVAIAIGQSRYGVDLSSGWQHEALGLITVGLALLMVVCSDRLLAFFLGPIAFADAEPLENPLSGAWNWCVSGHGSIETPPAVEDGPRQEVPSPPGKATVGNRWIVSAFLVLGVLQVAGLIRAASQLQEHSARTAALDHLDLFRQSDLPATVAGWSQVQFAAERLDLTRQLGAFHQAWGYRSKQCECVISVDYPFRWGHVLTGCYAGNGWSIVDSAERQPAAGSPPQPELSPQPERSPQPELYVEADMLGLTGEHGLLLYSLVDPADHVIDIPQHVTWNRLSGKAAYNPLWSRVLPARTFQVQAFVSSRDPLSDAERQAVQELYVAVRQKLLLAYGTPQRQAGDEPKR